MVLDKPDLGQERKGKNWRKTLIIVTNFWGSRYAISQKSDNSIYDRGFR